MFSEMAHMHHAMLRSRRLPTEAIASEDTIYHLHLLSEAIRQQQQNK